MQPEGPSDAIRLSGPVANGCRSRLCPGIAEVFPKLWLLENFFLTAGVSQKSLAGHGPLRIPFPFPRVFGSGCPNRFGSHFGWDW